MKILTLAVAAFLAANGVYMFIDPAAWYAMVPGVPATGPFNPHFVRDIGIAYIAAGAAFGWSVYGAGWRGSALAALFIGGHSLLHWGEFALGHHNDTILTELAAVHLPAIIIVVVAYMQRRAGA